MLQGTVQKLLILAVQFSEYNSITTSQSWPVTQTLL